MLCDPINCAELELELELEIEGADTGTEGRLLGRMTPHELVPFEFSEDQDDIRVVWKFEEFLMIGELPETFWCLNQVYRMDMADITRHEQATLAGHIDPALRECKRGFISDDKDQVHAGQREREREREREQLRNRNGRQDGSHKSLELNITCDGRFREVQVVSE